MVQDGLLGKELLFLILVQVSQLLKLFRGQGNHFLNFLGGKASDFLHFLLYFLLDLLQYQILLVVGRAFADSLQSRLERSLVDVFGDILLDLVQLFES